MLLGITLDAYIVIIHVESYENVMREQIDKKLGCEVTFYTLLESV